MGSVPNDTLHVGPGSSSAAFSVAVIGGGIGGLCLAIGLLKHPHIDIQIYEAAPSFGEIGAGVALGANAYRALKLIGPTAQAAFDKHATTNQWQSHANFFVQNRVGKGDREGEVIAEQRNSTGMLSVHRAHFLDELVNLIPKQRAHFGKRLVEIEDKCTTGGRVTLRFKDGSSTAADAVVGADGIHSFVRLHLLGESHPAARPVFAKSVVYRGLVSMDEAVEKLGSELASNSIMLCGPGAALMCYPIDHGEILNVAIIDFTVQEWNQEKWIVPANYADMAKKVEGWGKPAQAMCELINKPELAAWAMWDHPPAPIYSDGCVTMMGDAAHSTTPWQGQGASQATEDALVLETLLGKVKDAKHISNAFAAYDQARRPRTQRVVTTSRESGRLMSMQQEGVGGDIEKMRQSMETRMHWIWHRDLVNQNKVAVTLFEESL